MEDQQMRIFWFFNGPDLQVGSDGKVTIRFKAPATYFVSHWISVPHVHLRMCSNEPWQPGVYVAAGCLWWVSEGGRGSKPHGFLSLKL